MARLNKRIVIIAVVVVGVVAALSYRFASNIPLPANDNATPQAANEPNLSIAREISVVTSYEVPDGTDKVRFTLSLDSDGVVVAAKSTNALEEDVADENLEKFSQGLLLVIRGKKLSELKSIDRVGKSSLTTAAFNAALPDLQAQL